MSKGIGVLQRAILRVLGEKPGEALSTQEIAEAALGREVGPNDLNNVCGSIRGLLERGLITDMSRRWASGSHKWCLPADAEHLQRKFDVAIKPPRTKEQKTEAVMALLSHPHYKDWPQYKIAHACAVSVDTVRKAMKAVERN